MVNLKWRVTYDIVTHESAEHGDAAERGFVSPVFNTHFPVEECENVENLNRNGDLNRLVRDCHEFGVTLNEDADWLYNVDGRTDYRTGAVTTYAVHLECETARRNVERIGRLIEHKRPFSS